jgi:hypothetical protein
MGKTRCPYLSCYHLAKITSSEPPTRDPPDSTPTPPSRAALATMLASPNDPHPWPKWGRDPAGIWRPCPGSMARGSAPVLAGPGRGCATSWWSHPCACQSLCFGGLLSWLRWCASLGSRGRRPSMVRLHGLALQRVTLQQVLAVSVGHVGGEVCYGGWSCEAVAGGGGQALIRIWSPRSAGVGSPSWWIGPAPTMWLVGEVKQKLCTSAPVAAMRVAVAFLLGCCPDTLPTLRHSW